MEKLPLMILHGDLQSGNCLKVKYLADALGSPISVAKVDIMKGESRTPAFLAMNPWGQVPVLELADGRFLAQSNAILRFLAAGTPWLPADAFAAAKVDEWLFWEQYSHEPYVATCRFHMLYLGKSKETRDPQKVERGERALDHMERQLAGRDWLAGDRASIADIALVAYTQFADEGGFDLGVRPNVTAWVSRTRAALGIAA
jgi:glutathione S-transferase